MIGTIIIIFFAALMLFLLIGGIWHGVQKLAKIRSRTADRSAEQSSLGTLVQNSFLFRKLPLLTLLFAWQFPHFFALSHGVRQEYAAAGYRMLTSTNTAMAARVSLRYSLAMFPICGGLCYYEITDKAFAATSSVVNVWMLRQAI